MAKRVEAIHYCLEHDDGVNTHELDEAEVILLGVSRTGKTPVNATLEAARIMLGAIAASPAAQTRVGFKAAGGIRTVAEAAAYLALAQELLGAPALTPQRFRIGASSLLNDIEAVLSGAAEPGTAPPGAY